MTTCVAVVGPGDDLHRQLAVSAAEAGCAVALATLAPTRAQEFAVNSIANEAWVLGAEQFVRVQDATDPTAAAAFADEVVDRLGACHVAIFVTGNAPDVEADELSRDELLPLLDLQVNAPFLAVQAFGRVMQRQGAGTVIVAMPDKAGLPAAIIGGALMGLASNTARAWGNRGVWVHCVPPSEALKRLVATLAIQ